MTMLCSLCILSLMTGVYCQMQPKQTEVHITVYAPRSMLKAHQIGVFFNQHKRSDVESSTYNIKAYGNYLLSIMFCLPVFAIITHT